MANPQPVIVWFREDLRLSDHPALHAASQTGVPVICLYVLDEESSALQRPGARPIGGAARWWLAQSLRALQKALNAAGTMLVLRKGPAAKIIADLARETGAGAAFWNEIAQAPHQAVANDVEAALARIGVASRSFPGDLLASPAGVRNKEGRGFRVFTPFWRRVQVAQAIRHKPSAGTDVASSGRGLATDAIEDWRLEPRRPDWAGGLRETWTPGEASAQARLKSFLENARRIRQRSRPARSPRAHRDCRRTCALARSARGRSGTPRASPPPSARPSPATSTSSSANSAGANSAAICCSTCPTLRHETCSPSFDAFPWKRDDAGLAAWQRGQTGYPIVDAGMRELWHTGVMHNRVRMVVASFLVKHLLIDWRAGEQWFWDTLVDADAGSNPANWQWVAGSGADAAPYFRIFNPVLQGEKFDPDGAYVRRWVPELADLPKQVIHQPWRATPLELASAGVELGKTYPQPIVDHRLGRERALAAYAKIRNA